MSYNRNYGTRGNNQRYNTNDHFVPAGDLNQPTPTRMTRASAAATTGGSTAAYGEMYPPANQNQMRQSYNIKQQQQEQVHSSYTIAPQQTQVDQPAQPQPPLPTTPYETSTSDIEMKAEPAVKLDTSGDDQNIERRPRPPWMKNRTAAGGVVKVSKKERRRRQNENLRKLISPKNALMVLNEMLPGLNITNHFKLEPAAAAQFYSTNNQLNFCADLTIEGNSYKGYGENKLSARNAAAEMAIRDILIKKMAKITSEVVGDSTQNGEEETTTESNSETLPMIQLASYALHKLFVEWECEGHKVPQLKPNANTSLTTSDGEDVSVSTPRSRYTKKPKELPEDAASMHPCMLLTYMRPRLEYQELDVEGDKPQNTIFTIGVNVDGATYIGKAPSKKEARRQAARAACQELFGVKFV